MGLAICFCLIAEAQAQSLFYDFIELSSGSALASLELSALPATHEEVVGLSVTQVGDKVFGFGEVYDGEFNNSFESFVDDGIGGLRSPDIVGLMFSGNVDNSTIACGALPTSVVLLADSDQGEDLITIHCPGPQNDVNVFGDWRIVPEPSSSVLVVVASLVMLRRPRLDWRFRVRSRQSSS